MMKPIEEAKAKGRMLAGKVDPTQNSAGGKETRHAIADLAGVSHNTIRRVSAGGFKLHSLNAGKRALSHLIAQSI